MDPAMEALAAALEGVPLAEGAEQLRAVRVAVDGGGAALQLEADASRGVLRVRRSGGAEGAGAADGDTSTWPRAAATVEVQPRFAARAARVLQGVLAPPGGGGTGGGGVLGGLSTMRAMMSLRRAAGRGDVRVRGDMGALMALRGLRGDERGAVALAPSKGAADSSAAVLSLDRFEERLLELETELAAARAAAEEAGERAAAASRDAARIPAPPPPPLLTWRTRGLLAGVAVLIAGPALPAVLETVIAHWLRMTVGCVGSLGLMSTISRYDGGLLDRALATLGLYARIIPDFALARRAADRLDEERAAKLWERVHAWWGERLLDFCVDQGGMWIKMGQSMSARPDTMPAVLVRPLAALQDAVPPRPTEEIQASVCEALGVARIEDSFDEFDATPVGSASIAQVHRAVTVGGVEVAVKVRKRGVEPLFRQDMFFTRALARAVAWIWPDHDRRELAEYICSTVERELDLEQEGHAMERVRVGIASTGCRAPRLVSAHREVLIMEFISNAFKLTDEEALREYGVDREATCEAIGRSLACQFFELGIWNADLHPGNILLKPNEAEAEAAAEAAGGDDSSISSSTYDAPGATPYLIDFGNTASFTEGQVRGFALLVHAAATNDAAAVGAAFDALGIRADGGDDKAGRMSDLPRMLKSVRLLLSDTAHYEQQRELKREYMRWAKQDRALRKEKGRSHAKQSRVSFPTELLPFASTVLTFKGCCATLGVRVSPMTLFAPSALEALRRTSPNPPRSPPANMMDCLSPPSKQRLSLVIDEGAPSPRSLFAANAGRSWSASVADRALGAERVAAAIMQNLLAQDEGLGVQIAVFDANGEGGAGELILDLSGGVMDFVDGGDVLPSTLFHVSNVGEAVCAAWARRALARAGVDTNSPVASTWAAFGDAGKERVTMANVLSHTAGLEGALPAHFVPQASNGEGGAVGVGDIGACAAAVAAAAPAGAPSGADASESREERPLAEGAVHHYTLGHVAAGIVSAACGELAPTAEAVRASLREEFGPTLGEELQGELLFGAPDESGASTNLARIQSRLGPQTTRVTALEAAGVGEAALAALSARAAELGVGMEAAMHGGEWLLEPRMFNRPRVRAACQPSANVWSSARALARLYAELSGAREGASRVAVSETPASDGLRAARWSCDGQQVLAFADVESSEDKSGIGRIGRGAAAFGVDGVGIAVVSNTLTPDNLHVTKLATLLAIELGIGVPLDF